MHRNKIALVKRVVIAGGFLFLCAAPERTFSQSSPPAATPAPPAPIRYPAAPPRNSTAPPDVLAGLTLTDEQKVKIDQIKADTKSRISAVANDKKLSPEAANAMLRGYQRLENGKILEVLTLDQQRVVRRRISAWRTATGQTSRLQQPPKGNPQPK